MLIDHGAAQQVRNLREALGYSPEALAAAIKQAAQDEKTPWRDRGAVDAHTIRRIERHGHVPGPRVQFVLSQFLGFKAPHELWLPRSSRIATQQSNTRAAA